jgi:hypothetical protein
MSDNPIDTHSLAPLLRTLVSVVGRRADDPELVAFVTGALGHKKVPGSATDAGDNQYVIARKHGVEMVFDHDIKNDRYPLVPKTKKSFVPYLQLAWLKENFPEPLPLGVRHGMTPEELTERFGHGPAARGTAKVPVWKRVLDPARDIVFEVTRREITIGVSEARELSSRFHPPPQQVGLFLAWAIRRGLLDESRFPGHTDLIAAVREGRKRGSELLAAAMPLGVWDIHMKDVPGLRDSAFGWFHNIDHGYIVFDLIAVFGRRPGPHGHDEPVLDADDPEAVEKATAALDARFAGFLPGHRE